MLNWQNLLIEAAFKIVVTTITLLITVSANRLFPDSKPRHLAHGRKKLAALRNKLFSNGRARRQTTAQPPPRHREQHHPKK